MEDRKTDGAVGGGDEISSTNCQRTLAFRARRKMESVTYVAVQMVQLRK